MLKEQEVLEVSNNILDEPGQGIRPNTKGIKRLTMLVNWRIRYLHLLLNSMEI